MDKRLEDLKTQAEYFDNIRYNKTLRNLEKDNMNVYVIFYKASKGNWIDKAIDLYTNIGRGKNDLGTSHCELIMTKDTNIQNSTQLCFSSSGTDGGCRWKDIYIGDHWEVVDVTKFLSERRVTFMSILNKIYPEEGKKYDFLGLFFIELFKTKIHNKNKWYCSEIIMYLFDIGYSDDPNVLYNILTKDRNQDDKKYGRNRAR